MFSVSCRHRKGEGRGAKGRRGKEKGKEKERKTVSTHFKALCIFFFLSPSFSYIKSVFYFVTGKQSIIDFAYAQINGVANIYLYVIEELFNRDINVTRHCC
jgi:hypothetical protein